MPRKVRCIQCNDNFTLQDDEAQDCNTCQECFDMLEESNGRPPDYEQKSDADPGL